jgi:hypothetical protein
VLWGDKGHATKPTPVATSFIGVFFGGLKEMRAQINTELDYNYQADVN